jgi:hypothetical protein
MPAPFQPFVLSERYVDVECDEPGYEGFTINVRMNLSNGERAELERALDDRVERIRVAGEKRQAEIDRLNALVVEAAEADDGEKTQRLTEKLTALAEDARGQVAEITAETRIQIAPYVRRWNVYMTGPDGELVEAPAPQQAGPSAFDAIDETMVNWIARTILQAYRGGKGLSAWRTNAGAAPAPTETPSGAAPKGTGTPSSRASRRSSPSPAA